MDKNGQIGELLEKGQTTVTNSVQDTANTVRTQVLGDTNNNQVLPNPNSGLPSQAESQVQRDNIDYTREAVSNFYSPSENGEPSISSAPVETDEQKLARLRQDLDGEKQKHRELHDEVYYKPLIAYEQRQPSQQERPAEVAQADKQHDLQEHIDKQAKKDQDIATQRAQRQVEIKGGVSG